MPNRQISKHRHLSLKSCKQLKFDTLKTALAIIEIVIGLFLLLLGGYFLLSNLNCTPQAVYCVPMGAFVAVLSLVPGCIIMAAGILCRSNRRFRFWKVQAAMIGIIFLYFVSMLAAASLFSQ